MRKAQEDLLKKKGNQPQKKEEHVVQDMDMD